MNRPIQTTAFVDKAEPPPPLTKLYSDLIRHMGECGWEQRGDHVTHPEVVQTFGTWLEAIKACITFASVPQ